MIKCRYCDERVAKKDEYKTHFNQNHVDDVFLDSPAGMKYDCVCDNCGSEFERAWSQITKAQYCCLDCHTNQKTNTQSKFYKEQRKKVLDRDDYTCQACLTPKKLSDHRIQVHHITPRKDFDDNDKEAHKLNNLVTLCEKCHRQWEGIYLRPDTL